MGLTAPSLLISLKTYPGTAGHDGLELASEIERAIDFAPDGSTDSGIGVAIAPQIPDIRQFSQETTLRTIAQAADETHTAGRTGSIQVETLSRAGADAVFVDHPEREQSLGTIASICTTCETEDMDAIVCVETRVEAFAALELGADWLLYEHPSDIASGEPLVEREPAQVRAFVDAVRTRNADVDIALGGGISRPEHVEAAFECGANGVGTASAVVEADDPAQTVREFLEGFPPDE